MQPDSMPRKYNFPHLKSSDCTKNLVAGINILFPPFLFLDALLSGLNVVSRTVKYHNKRALFWPLQELIKLFICFVFNKSFETKLWIVGCSEFVVWQERNWSVLTMLLAEFQAINKSLAAQSHISSLVCQSYCIKSFCLFLFLFCSLVLVYLETILFLSVALVCRL